MRYSKQREQILNIVRGAKNHPTADWVYDQARKTMPNVSLGTVYRNLGQLSAQHLIHSFQYKGIVHYDGNIDQHGHFACEQCGRIYDITLPFQQIVSQIETSIDHRVTDYQFHLVGICKTCKTKIN